MEWRRAFQASKVLGNSWLWRRWHIVKRCLNAPIDVFLDPRGVVICDDKPFNVRRPTYPLSFCPSFHLCNCIYAQIEGTDFSVLHRSIFHHAPTTITGYLIINNKEPPKTAVLVRHSIAYRPPRQRATTGPCGD